MTVSAHKPASILIVDDEKSITYLLSEVLQKDGHDVRTLSDGKMVKDDLRKHHYDLVVSDLHMRQVGGIEVLKTVKNKDENTEVLILTGHGTISTAVEAMKLSAFEFLSAQVGSRLILVMGVTAIIYFGTFFMIRFTMNGSVAALFFVFGLGAICLISMGLLVAARKVTDEVTDDRRSPSSVTLEAVRRRRHTARKARNAAIGRLVSAGLVRAIDGGLTYRPTD